MSDETTETETEAGLQSYPCSISIIGCVVYSSVAVSFTDGEGTHHKFSGDAWGVGVGDIDGPGVIYFSDLNDLIHTESFGVAFVADDGGTAMVTWGSRGNANIVGVGVGAGTFGGSGKWK
jgi:hypothetical protein